MTVNGRTRYILFDKLRTAAIAMAPNATWLNPSPIKLNRFKTKVTPSRLEQSEIKTPTINAYCTNEKLK